MFAAAAQKHFWSFDKLTLGWFDVAFVLLLAFGLWRGRKRGMSKELLPVLMWLGIVIGGAAGYQLLGDELLATGYIRKVFGTTFVLRTASYITAYLAIAFVVWVIFAIIKNLFKHKVEGANAFGSGEYYLGMAAGVARIACMVFFGLAILHAPFYSPAEIAARAAYNKQNFGGGLYEGNYLADMPTFQNSIFKNSLLGPVIDKTLPWLLIEKLSGGKKSDQR